MHFFLHNPHYMKTNKDIQFGLQSIYTDYVKPVLNGDIPFVPWWENAPSKYSVESLPYANASVNTEERCDYIAYREMQQWALTEHAGYRSIEDKLVWKTNTYGKNEKKGKMSLEVFKKNINPFFKTIVDVLNENQNLGYKNMGLSNNPMWYREYMGNKGYMGWHTNCDKPGNRFYLVYNTDANSSFFRYMSDGKMYTVKEPKGWSFNQFLVDDCSNELWHCIYTKTNRISIGLWGGKERPLDADGYILDDQPSTFKEYKNCN